MAPDAAAPFAAILVAAGRSSRMGTDKLWEDLWGRPTWRWSLDVLLATPGLARVVVAVPADGVDRFRAAMPPSAAERCLVVPGGEARADSVIAGIWALTVGSLATRRQRESALHDIRANGGPHRHE